jgi:sodium-independent sulfate anion transporter 11
MDLDVIPTAKRYGKRIIDYPEEVVPVVGVKEWVGQYTSNPIRRVQNYVLSLFPVLSWITRYNLTSLSSDFIAGLTVGIVVVPQSMSYAQVATLPPQYGLYSSFVGAFFYFFFATSKDVTIGPVAVASLTVAHIIGHIQEDKHETWTGPQIATTLAFICGFIVLGIGLLRLGWIVEFIPAPTVSAFMTGSALNIAAGQVAGLLGIAGVNTRLDTYIVVIDTLKGLPNAKLDSAFGVTGLVCLYAIRSLCTWFSKRYPSKRRLFFFLSVMRSGLVIIVLTIAAWLYCRHRSVKGKYPIKILLTVPSGLKDVGRPHIDRRLLEKLAPDLPIMTIIMLLEHIAIGKTFGRLNGYTINPSQELIAIGVANTVGSCFGAYPATGSFSRTAIKSRSGVRTPAAGIVTAIVVIVALYGLTKAFFWIPTAGLSAVIIHAVVDLVASPAQVYSFWRVSPLEFIIWVATVLITVFSTIENGIYTSICVSVALLLIRVAHPRGALLGKATVGSDSKHTREIFLPLENSENKGSDIRVVPASPGIIIYRFEESYVYPNCAYATEQLTDYVKSNMRRGQELSRRDRLWNDPGPRSNGEDGENESKPVLRAIVLDFSSVSQIDSTAIQALVDTRNVVERWTGHAVEFHFAAILSPWIRRALIAGGFGLGISPKKAPHDIVSVVPYKDNRGDGADVLQEARTTEDDVESGGTKKEYEPHTSTPKTPFFHLDLEGAVRAAEYSLGN